MNRSWVSRSECKRLSRDAVGRVRFGHEYGERRQIDVPLDERGDDAETRDRTGVQPPHIVADPRIVGVDEHGMAFELARAMAGQMYLADRGARNSQQIVHGIESVI